MIDEIRHTVNILPRQTTSQQLALALFDELLPTGTSITESPREIGFRRNNLFVTVVDLGLVARRAVDAAYFIASQDQQVQASYNVELNYFKWLMMYSSGNRVHLRTVLRDAQKAALEGDAATDETEKWGSIALLGPVWISEGRLTFEIDARLQKLIKDPVQSQFFSLRVSNMFTSTYARALYDHLLVYSDIGMTDWLTLDIVREWSDAQIKSFTEFKYFKRDGLDPAVKQINAMSNLQVSYTTAHVPGSKKVGKLRFVVKIKTQDSSHRLDMLGSKELYDILRGEFGLSPTNMEEILENRNDWSNDRIHQAIDFTRFSIERQKVTKSVSGFFMKALRDNLLVSSSDIKVAGQLAAKDAVEQGNTLVAEQRIKRVAAVTTSARDQAEERALSEGKIGLMRFEKLESMARQEVVAEFTRTQPARMLAKRAKIALTELTEESLLQHPALATLLGQFIFLKIREPGLL